MTELRTLKVALLGCGNVGAQVARILIDDAEMLASRAGARRVARSHTSCVKSSGVTKPRKRASSRKQVQA